MKASERPTAATLVPVAGRVWVIPPDGSRPTDLATARTLASILSELSTRNGHVDTIAELAPLDHKSYVAITRAVGRLATLGLVETSAPREGAGGGPIAVSITRLGRQALKLVAGNTKPSTTKET